MHAQLFAFSFLVLLLIVFFPERSSQVEAVVVAVVRN